jgi:ribosomal protein S18 acetylase RimI-like enzyme
MTSMLHIRDASLSDIPAMDRIEHASFPGNWLSVRSMRRFIREGRALCLVAERDGAVAGDAFVVLRRDSLMARLYSIAVDPALRNAGIGSALLAESERRAVKAGKTSMRLEVREDNNAAIRRYLATGYTVIGRKPGFYEDGAAAQTMKKSLAGIPA